MSVQRRCVRGGREPSKFSLGSRYNSRFGVFFSAFLSVWILNLSPFYPFLFCTSHQSCFPCPSSLRSRRFGRARSCLPMLLQLVGLNAGCWGHRWFPFCTVRSDAGRDIFGHAGTFLGQKSFCDASRGLEIWMLKVSCVWWLSRTLEGPTAEEHRPGHLSPAAGTRLGPDKGACGGARARGWSAPLTWGPGRPLTETTSDRVSLVFGTV